MITLEEMIDKKLNNLKFCKKCNCYHDEYHLTERQIKINNEIKESENK